ncbi:hypothetical protein RFI_21520 [Reticulomyxa filosa]|uniref:Uncharacterized protein n=1 Tax=Reticulomyxa filosa TaxID=46433 RepID=X6MPB7_RETFI|nr:hypothetical protein RFI_21520 [Reticulomyxa filosa]|eukprot:ETO15843.1 hypothetical protein RFI_21520 [Reticulomyxa filosa]
MAKRVNRQLKKQLEEQKNLEEELDKLQNGKDPKESCAEVIKFIEIFFELKKYLKHKKKTIPKKKSNYFFKILISFVYLICLTKKKDRMFVLIFKTKQKKENNPFTVCFLAGTQILVNKQGKHKKIEELRVGEVIQCLVPTHESFKESIDCEIKDIPNVMTDAVVAAIHSSVSYSICSIKYRNLTTVSQKYIFFKNLFYILFHE